VNSAAGRGSACLVVHELPADDTPPNVPLVLVQDTTKSLGRLAGWHRAKFSIPVVAVTGLAGCREVPTVAAYVGGAQLTNAQVENMLNQFEADVRSSKAADIREIIVRDFVLNQLSRQLAKEHGITIPATDTGQPAPLAAVRLEADEQAAFNAIQHLGTPQPPSEADRREVWESLVAQQKVDPGDYNADHDRIDSPELQQALGLRVGGRQVSGPPHHLFDRAQRQGRAGEHVVDPAGDGGVKVRARHDLVHDPETESFACLDAAAGQQQCHGVPERDLARQERHAAVKRQAADPRLRQAESRLLGRHHDVATEHHLESATERMTIDPGDYRHIERLAQRDPAEAA